MNLTILSGEPHRRGRAPLPGLDLLSQAGVEPVHRHPADPFEQPLADPGDGAAACPFTKPGRHLLGVRSHLLGVRS
jgi:hypothetical protein